ncbi:hypothetical protein GCM10028803_47910 [Larkinella knui]|uniref:Uncharacterized protein n=1 Tax=Larkinella knui TaxID=2025310 RepID=A0A3P1CQ81_9BACT|nr:hypothetical protein [Larkinella knui]RRB15370.1 hypothetical protein EHT87_12615 [Larkinella knui]
MSTLTITLTDEQAARYGLQSDSMTLDQLVDKIKTEVARDALHKCQAIAGSNGLSEISLDEINAEIEAVRNAKTGY